MNHNNWEHIETVGFQNSAVFLCSYTLNKGKICFIWYEFIEQWTGRWYNKDIVD